MYKKENNIKSGHRNAVVCTNSAHCQAYTSYEKLKKTKGEDWIKNDYVKIKKAVDDTKGQILTYDDKAILPLYFSFINSLTSFRYHILLYHLCSILLICIKTILVYCILKNFQIIKNIIRKIIAN